MYYDFHAKAKRLIAGGHLLSFKTVSDHNGIKPALLLYFDNHDPIAVSKDKWAEYSDAIICSIDEIY